MAGVEILGIAASVIQLADVGARLSVKLFTFSRKVKDAKTSIAQLSQEIASTGAALHELGSILEDDGVASLGSRSALATTKQLLADCWQVFEGIGDTMGDKKLLLGKNGKAGSQQIPIDMQASFRLKQRLKFPFIEADVHLLKTKLESLKSSLMLMLQILSIALQIRSHPKVSISQDQELLVQTLLVEREDQDRQFTQLMKRLEMEDNDKTQEMISSRPTVNQKAVRSNSARAADSNFTHLSTSIEQSSEVRADSNLRDQASHLPIQIRVRAREIKDHTLLTNVLVNEVGNSRYELSHGIRDRMERAILRSHCHEWWALAQKHDHQMFLDLFPQNGAVTKYWINQYGHFRDDGKATDDDDARILPPFATAGPNEDRAIDSFRSKIDSPTQHPRPSSNASMNIAEAKAAFTSCLGSREQEHVIPAQNSPASRMERNRFLGASVVPSFSEDVTRFIEMDIQEDPSEVHHIILHSYQPEKELPIEVKDVYGRTYKIAWETGRHWTKLSSFLTQMFASSIELGPQIEQERYDVVGPDGEIIMPSNWDTVIKPGTSVRMSLWPLPESELADEQLAELPSKFDLISDSEAKGRKPQPQPLGGWMLGGSMPRRGRQSKRKRSVCFEDESLSGLLLEWTTLQSEEISEATKNRSEGLDERETSKKYQRS